MSFNVNCKDCKYCRVGIYGGYYCVHPMVFYYSKEPAKIKDIESNIDCDWYGKN